jgi:hypothetical protein
VRPTSPTAETSDLKSRYSPGSNPGSATKPTHLNTMEFLSAIRHLIPEFHAYADDDQRYNLGATWTAADGLKDYHNLELRYVRNSERLALQGDPQPDGSWRYVEPTGRVHTMSAERAKMFMEQTHAHATIMCGMLDRLKESGLLEEVVDTQAQPA